MEAALLMNKIPTNLRHRIYCRNPECLNALGGAATNKKDRIKVVSEN